jgi:hypothetical protein
MSDAARTTQRRRGRARQEPYREDVARDNVVDDLADGDVAGCGVVPCFRRKRSDNPLELGGGCLKKVHNPGGYWHRLAKCVELQ